MIVNKKGQFTSETYASLTAEEKIKRAQSLKEAWKSRSDYISDIVNENPKLYNSWRAIRFTEKGKKAGCCKEWEEYRTFFNDINPFYEEGKRLIRKDPTKPWDKNNFMFATNEEVGESKAKKVLFYDNEWLSLKEAALKYNQTISAVKNRYYKHKDDYSIEEIIFGKSKKRKDKTVKDWTNKESERRSKASKMISSYKCSDKKNKFEQVCDIDVDWMLENIVNKPCIYCGDTHRIGCDRIDNDKGHTKDNVVPCCYDCNCARNNNFTYEEMLILGKTIKQIKENRR